MKRICANCGRNLQSEVGSYLYPKPQQDDLRVGALYCKECARPILEVGKGVRL